MQYFSIDRYGFVGICSLVFMFPCAPCMLCMSILPGRSRKNSFHDIRLFRKWDRESRALSRRSGRYLQKTLSRCSIDRVRRRMYTSVGDTAYIGKNKEYKIRSSQTLNEIRSVAWSSTSKMLRRHRSIKDKPIYFCSQRCKEKFDQNPQQYVKGQQQSVGRSG